MAGVRVFESEPAPPGRPSAFASLRHRQFRWLYASNTAFFFAMNGQMIVRSILAFRLTDSALALGLVNLAVAVPMLVISPFAGVVTDRVEKRQLIIGGQALLIASELVIFGLLTAGALAFWHLVVTVFLMGCIFPFIMPARQAIVVGIVGRGGLPNAMALQMGGMNAARVAAPVLAGFLVAMISIRGAYAVSIALYTLALAAMFRVSRSPATDEQRSTLFRDMLAGVRYVRDDHPLRVLLLLSIVPMLLAMPFQALLVVFTEDVWHTGSRALGILQAAAGLGGLMGSVYVAWFGDSPRRVRLMISSLLAFGATLFLFALSPWFLLALPLVLISDIFASIFGTVNATAVQLLVPDAVRGRVMSLMMMTYGLTPLGTLPISAVAQRFGAPAAVAGACVVMMALAVAFYVLSPSLRGVDDTCRRAALQPHPQPRTAHGPEPQPAAAAS